MIATETEQKVVINLGCGPYKDGSQLPDNWRSYRELRVDIDPSYEPDIIASMTDLSPIADETADALFCRGALEHLYQHEVPKALAEMNRVLKPGGEIIITTIDIEKIFHGLMVLGLNGVAYVSGRGPITIHDIIYGYGEDIEKGHAAMAHHSGFTSHTLRLAMKNAGFSASAGDWQVGDKIVPFGLCAVGHKVLGQSE